MHLLMFLVRSSPALLISMLLFLAPAAGQDHRLRYESMDVLSYRFEVDLNDSTDILRGVADIEIEFLKDVDQFYLDLSSGQADTAGMIVQAVTENGKKVTFEQLSDQISLTKVQASKGTRRTYKISYHGIPTDGLIISKNKFGDRTFFGDNWPDRGHHWLPLVDHPSDKAVVEFLVHAPDHYQVVSVGTRQEEFREGGRVTSHWLTSYPLSTKMMVIGVSPFEVQHLESASGIPVSSWVYPQNKEAGFLDYSMALQPLDFFESYLAPYPYKKLANVQSKTVYGGMENASCIFYHERSVSGEQRIENLLAHEIAHQWFGDAVSELDWHHIWISEGFATYLTDLYIEHTHGREAFVASMLDEKGQVLRFARRRLAPIVDTTLPISARLLNKNVYEKAGWVLHMLRHDMGDEKFRECVQTFYEKFKFENALTDDFLEVVESVTGKEYDNFFQQWFHEAGHPVLSYEWKAKRRTIELNLKQHQEQHEFQFPIDIEIRGKAGKSVRKTVEMDAREKAMIIELPFKAKEVLIDPDTWLFYELKDL
ncbi:MAG: M1 family peptidase [Bacteroidia bacterium]|nr:MAG: M1 family peptidase [Bacteroidia bacterium]